MAEPYTEGFEKGIFWETFHDLERQLVQYLDYLPYLEGNETAYSFRLLNIFTSIGGYIDSSFKEISRYPNYVDKFKAKKAEIDLYNSGLKEGEQPKYLGFRTYYFDVINDIYKLSDKTIIFKRLPKREKLTPFKDIGWWETYNDAKHDFGKYLKNASLKNTVNAMGAAFLINAIHRPSLIRLYEYDILTPTYNGKPKHQLVTEHYPTKGNFECYLDQGGEIGCQLETDLFVYNIEVEPKK